MKSCGCYTKLDPAEEGTTILRTSGNIYPTQHNFPEVYSFSNVAVGTSNLV